MTRTYVHRCMYVKLLPFNGLTYVRIHAHSQPRMVLPQARAHPHFVLHLCLVMNVGCVQCDKYGFFVGEKIPPHLPPFLLQIVFKEDQYGMNAELHPCTTILYIELSESVPQYEEGRRQSPYRNSTYRGCGELY